MELFDISIIVLLAPPLIKATSRHCVIAQSVQPANAVNTTKLRAFTFYNHTRVQLLNKNKCDHAMYHQFYV